MRRALYHFATTFALRTKQVVNIKMRDTATIARKGNVDIKPRFFLSNHKVIAIIIGIEKKVT